MAIGLSPLRIVERHVIEWRPLAVAGMGVWIAYALLFGLLGFLRGEMRMLCDQVRAASCNLCWAISCCNWA